MTAVEHVERKLSLLRSRQQAEEIEVGGIRLSVGRNVYPTTEVSELMLEAFERSKAGKPIGTVLDYGTGAGFLALNSALRGHEVVATDINNSAIECAQANAKSHGVENKIDFRCGVGWSTIKSGEIFDIIFAGLPWDDQPVTDNIGYSMYDPGFQMRKDLFQNAVRNLADAGEIFLTYSESAQKRNPMQKFSNDFVFEKYVSRMIDEEEHFVLRATINGSTQNS